VSAQAFSTVTLATVTGVSVAVLANTRYEVEVFGAFTSAATTTGMAMALAIPSGTVFGTVSHPVSATASGSCEQIATGATTGATTGVRAAATNVPLYGCYFVTTGVIPGNITLMARSEIAASAITLTAGLTMRVTPMP
jgi:hypothetical protein